MDDDKKYGDEGTNSEEERRRLEEEKRREEERKLEEERQLEEERRREEERKREEEPDEEDEDENEEEFEEIEVEESGNGGLIAFLVIFIILFILSTTLLFYFQFYQGNGNWDFTFKKNATESPEYVELNEKNNKLQQQVDSLKTASLNIRPDTSGYTGETESRYNNVSGTVYEVQIGAFREFNPTQYQQNMVNMDISYEEGMVKLTIGRFKDLNASKKFRRDIVNMGVKDAFIVKKSDGVRQEIIHTY